MSADADLCELCRENPQDDADGPRAGLCARCGDDLEQQARADHHEKRRRERRARRDCGGGA